LADFAARPHSLAQWLDYQQGVHGPAIDLSLERVRSVAATLDLLHPVCPLAIVGGTNGKGSTATMLAAMLQACGRRVGLFTSPHLLRYTERVQLDGKPVGEASLVAAFERIERARGATTLTFFEYNTLAALQIFQGSNVDALVLEVGLGGRLDATNILDADVAVLCSVGIDHRDWLGDTLEAIGHEKAGIFRPGQSVVLGSPDMPSSVWDAVSALGCRAYTAGREFQWRARQDDVAAPAAPTLVPAPDWDYEGVQCRLTHLPAPALQGAIQYSNAASALTALQLLEVPGACERERIAQALRSVHLPGRLQIARIDGIEWILDVAHNAPAAEVLARALHLRAGTGRTIGVMGILADKDAAAIAHALDGEVDAWVLAGLTGEARGQSAEALAARLGQLRSTPLQAATVPEALRQGRALARPGDRIVVLGSFHVVGPALAWLGLY
jgi:dihydrofolate synthase/folylpolyglutamate synthase